MSRTDNLNSSGLCLPDAHAAARGTQRWCQNKAGSANRCAATVARLYVVPRSMPRAMSLLAMCALCAGLQKVGCLKKVVKIEEKKNVLQQHCVAEQRWILGFS